MDHFIYLFIYLFIFGGGVCWAIAKKKFLHSKSRKKNVQSELSLTHKQIVKVKMSHFSRVASSRVR